MSEARGTGNLTKPKDFAIVQVTLLSLYSGDIYIALKLLLTVIRASCKLAQPGKIEITMMDYLFRVS